MKILLLICLISLGDEISYNPDFGVTVDKNFRVLKIEKDKPGWCTGLKKDDILVGYSYRNFLTTTIHSYKMSTLAFETQIPPIASALDGSYMGIHIYRPNKGYAAVIRMQWGSQNNNFPERKLGFGVSKPVPHSKKIVVAYVDDGLPTEKYGLKKDDIITECGIIFEKEQKIKLMNGNEISILLDTAKDIKHNIEDRLFLIVERPHPDKTFKMHKIEIPVIEVGRNKYWQDFFSLPSN